jgi:HEAT repeat protein
MAWPIVPPAVRLLALIILLQYGQDSGTPDLIRKLGSADPGERTTAYDKLKEQGEATRPWLEKAVRDPDSEVAARAGMLLRRIDFQKELPRGVPSPTPETLDRLAQGEDPEWVSLYLVISKREPRSSESRHWLERYTPQAFRSATTPDEKKNLCDALGSLDRKAFREVLNFLKDEGDGVREKAVETLGKHFVLEREEELAALLEDANPATRSAAAEALGSIFEGDAFPLLHPLLGDPSPEVRRSVLSTLRLFLWESGVNSAKLLTPLLKDPDGDIRETAAERLGEHGGRDGVPFLLTALEDKEPGVRARTAEALGKLGAAEAAPGLLSLLRRDPELQVRQQAALALGGIPGRDAIPELLARAEDLKEDEFVRAAARSALSALKAPEALQMGRSFLKDAQPAIRLSAVQMLLALEDRPSAGALALMLKDTTENQADSVVSLLLQKTPSWMVDSVLPLLEDSSWMVRKRAIRVLQALKSERAMPAIVRRLADEHLEVRDAAMLGGDWIRTPEATLELRNVLRHSAPDVRRRAVECVLPLVGAPGAEDLVPLVDDVDPMVRASAIKKLAGLERLQDLSRFVRRLEDSDRSVRELAASAIVEQHGWVVLPKVRTLAATGPKEARPEALRLLWKMGDSEHAPEILSLLASSNADVQKAALQALNPLEAKAGAGDILPLLGSADAQVRAEALGTLAALGAREALPRIRPLLKDPGPSVRIAALEALADLGDRESIPAVVKQFEEGNRAGVCGFLASVGAREAVPLLEELLENDPAYFNESLQALGRLGATTSARKVFAHFGEKIEWGGNLAARTLGILGARELIPDLRKYLRHRSGHLRSQAAIALGELHATEAVTDLLPLLTDRDDRVVTHAAEALGRIGAKEAIPGIRSALRERSWSADMTWWITCGVGARPRRGSLLEALVRLNAREAVPDLLELLHTEPAPSNLDIVTTLRLLRDPTARTALRDYLLKNAEPFSDPNAWPEEWSRVPRVLLSRDPDYLRYASYSTAEFLAELGAKEFTPDLVRLLNEGPWGFRLAAAQALCLLGSDQGVGLILAESEHGDTGGLLSLNALRRPALWARMAETRFPKTGSLSKRGLWQKIARAMGVRLEMPQEAYSRPSVDSCDRFDVSVYEDLFSLLDVARELLARTSFQMILEEDRIRIVPEKEAVQFWKKWPGR